MLANAARFLVVTGLVAGLALPSASWAQAAKGKKGAAAPKGELSYYMRKKLEAQKAKAGKTTKKKKAAK